MRRGLREPEGGNIVLTSKDLSIRERGKTMGQKRKIEGTAAIDETDKVLYSVFSNAANSLSHLYSQSLNQQKLAFEAGQRHALEKLNEWILKKQQDGLMVTTADISAYLQNELNSGLQLNNEIHNRQNEVQLSLAAPLTQSQDKAGNTFSFDSEMDDTP